MRAVEGVSPYNHILALYGYTCYIPVRVSGDRWSDRPLPRGYRRYRRTRTTAPSSHFDLYKYPQTPSNSARKTL